MWAYTKPFTLQINIYKNSITCHLQDFGKKYIPESTLLST